MCLSPVKYYKRTIDGKFKECCFPCGRCLECVKSKQNDMVQVYYLAGQKYPGKQYFFTLTYDNNSIPLLLKPTSEYEIRELNSDELDVKCSVDYSKNRFTKYGDEDAYIRKLWIEDYERRKSCLNRSDVENSPMYVKYRNEYYVTASVCEKDISDWLKRCRKNYKTKYGEDLGDIGYGIKGEYGTKFKRPHYHGIFFGIDEKKAQFLKDEWQRYYGFCYVKEIQAKGKPNIDGAKEAVSRYVAKYQNKGFFEEDIVTEGYVYKPRLHVSFNLFELSKDRIEYYRGVSFLGKDLRSIKDYTDEELERLNNRLYITINGKQYRLGKHIKSQVFKNKIKKTKVNGEIKYSVRSDSLQKALSKFVQSEFDKRVAEKYEAVSLDDPSVNYFQLEVDEIIADQVERQANSEVLYQQQRQFYSKSKF